MVLIAFGKERLIERSCFNTWANLWDYILRRDHYLIWNNHNSRIIYHRETTTVIPENSRPIHLHYHKLPNNILYQAKPLKPNT